MSHPRRLRLLCHSSPLSSCPSHSQTLPSCTIPCSCPSQSSCTLPGSCHTNVLSSCLLPGSRPSQAPAPPIPMSSPRHCTPRLLHPPRLLYVHSLAHVELPPSTPRPLLHPRLFYPHRPLPLLGSCTLNGACPLPGYCQFQSPVELSPLAPRPFPRRFPPPRLLPHHKLFPPPKLLQSPRLLSPPMPLHHTRLLSICSLPHTQTPATSQTPVPILLYPPKFLPLPSPCTLQNPHTHPAPCHTYSSRMPLSSCPLICSYPLKYPCSYTLSGSCI